MVSKCDEFFLCMVHTWCPPPPHDSGGTWFFKTPDFMGGPTMMKKSGGGLLLLGGPSNLHVILGGPTFIIWNKNYCDFVFVPYQGGGKVISLWNISCFTENSSFSSRHPPTQMALKKTQSYYPRVVPPNWLGYPISGAIFFPYSHPLFICQNTVSSSVAWLPLMLNFTGIWSG